MGGNDEAVFSQFKVGNQFGEIGLRPHHLFVLAAKAQSHDAGLVKAMYAGVLDEVFRCAVGERSFAKLEAGSVDALEKGAELLAVAQIFAYVGGGNTRLDDTPIVRDGDLGGAEAVADALEFFLRLENVGVEVNDFGQCAGSFQRAGVVDFHDMAHAVHGVSNEFEQISKLGGHDLRRSVPGLFLELREGQGAGNGKCCTDEEEEPCKKFLPHDVSIRP